MRSALFAVSVLACGCGVSPRSPNALDGAPSDGGVDTVAPSIDSPIDAMIDAAIDAPPDAMVDAPPPGPVTMIATWGRHPFPGVTFYVQDTPTSAPTMLVGGSDGSATATIASGGFVTAVFPPTNGNVWTLVLSDGGVQPGDTLYFQPNRDDPAPDQMTVQFTAQAGTGMTEYILETSCGSAQMSTTAPAGTVLSLVTNLDACGPTMDLAIETVPETGTNLYIYEANVAATAGSTLDLTADVFVAPPTVTGSLANVPPTWTGSQFQRDAALPNGGDVFGGGSLGSPGPAPLPSGTASWSEIWVGDGQHDNVYVDEWPAPGPTLFLDVATVDLAEFATVPAWSAPDRAALWQSGPGATPQAVTATIEVTGAGASWYHYVTEPWQGTPRVVFPELPAFSATAANTVQVTEVSEDRQPTPFSWARQSDYARVSGAPGRATARQIFP